MSYEVIHGNALALPLEDETVDLIITSPPYFALRSYRDGDEHYDGQVGSEPTPQEFLEALWAATREMVRVLKPSGSIWVNLGDKYAGSGGHNNGAYGVSGLHKDRPSSATRDAGIDVTATRRNAPDRYNQNSGGIPTKSLMGLPWRYANGCVDQLGLILRAEIIWSKPNGLPESVTDRVRRSHETWFHMVKSPRYFAAVDEVRNPYVPHSVSTPKPYATENPGINHGTHGSTLGSNANNPMGALPPSVWTIPSEPLIVPEHLGLPDHFAAFPQEWPRRIILGWSPSGICVACGEGRRPVVDRKPWPVEAKRALAEARGGGAKDNADRADGDYLYGIDGAAYNAFRAENPQTITGYACACPDATAATRPAVVLDVFGGTGTVAMVARALGRYGVSVDLSADYCRLAEWRIFQSGHADNLVRKAIESGAMDAKQVPPETLERARPKNAPQPTSLFDS